MSQLLILLSVMSDHDGRCGCGTVVTKKEKKNNQSDSGEWKRLNFDAVLNSFYWMMLLTVPHTTIKTLSAQCYRTAL